MITEIRLQEEVEKWLERHNIDNQIVLTEKYNEKIWIADWNTVPEKIQELIMGKLSLDLVFEDEGSICGNCYRFIYSGAEIWLSDCEIACKECALEFIEDVIQEYREEGSHSSANIKGLGISFIPGIKKEGFEEEKEEYQVGYHVGDIDEPAKIIQRFPENKELILIDNGSDAFTARYKIYSREIA